MNNDDMARLSEAEVEMALAAYLAPLVEGKRVHWALGAGGPGLAYLEGAAATLTVGDVPPDGEALGWWVRRWPAAAALDDLEALMASSQQTRALALLLSDRDALPALREACAARFAELRVFGLAALRAAGLAELGASPDGVAFDDSLAASRAPVDLVLLAGADLSELESYVVVALPTVGPRLQSPDGSSSAPSDESHADEIAGLEQKLQRAAQLRRDAERERDRRGALLRDWASAAAAEPHAARAVKTAETSTPHEYALRAAAAEASREQARFAADELRLALRASHADAEGAHLTEAALEGRARGLEARLAEVEEMREAAEAQLALAHADVQDAADAKLRVERRLADAEEAVEMAVVLEHGDPASEGTNEARFAALEQQLEQLEAGARQLQGQLEQLEQERDHARGESLRLLALVGSLEHAAEGMRRGHARRVAELSADAAEQSLASDLRHAAMLSELGGEIAGLKARLGDREAALAARASVRQLRHADEEAAAGVESRGRIDELLDQVDALRAEVAELRDVRHELTLRVADLSSSSQVHATRAADLASFGAARDALVERLQLDLVEEEQRSRRREESRQRAEAECARLRDAVVRAAEEAAARPSEPPGRLDALEQTEIELRRALREAEHGLDSERNVAEAARVAADEAAAHAATAEGSLGAERQRAAEIAAQLELARSRADASRVALEETRGLLTQLRQEHDARGRKLAEITAVGSDAPSDADETLMRSLTAQLEERNDRIRGLEARLTAASDGDSARLALEETVAKLSAELAHERAARETAAAAGGDEATRAELERLRQTLRDRYADMLRARSEVEGVEAQASALRGAVAEARGGLEALLGDATATGDTTTADRVGALLRLLGRF